MRVTIKELNRMLFQKDQTILARQNEIDDLKRNRNIELENVQRELSMERKMRESGQFDLDRANDEIDILRSDRDRLTTVVEVCARRLVSPQVEKMGDRRRAGWRAGNQAIQPLQPALPSRESNTGSGTSRG